jgi:hypothetical protein
MSRLGLCLTFSALLNGVGFAPLMTFLLGRGGATTQPPRPPLQIRLLNKHLEPPKAPVPLEAPPEKAREIPKLAQHTSAPPKKAKPGKSENPQEVPQARPPRHHSKPSKAAVPSGPLTRPDDRSLAVVPPPTSGNASPFNSPGKTTTPAPPGDGPAGDPTAETPSPTPSPADSPTPLAADTNTQPATLPVSGGEKPDQGTIPDKPAAPRSNPPNNFSRIVLRKIGGKQMIRLQVKIYPDGHIEPLVLVSSGSAELDAAVLKDLKDWKWDPAEAAGKPVPSERPVRLKLEAD